MTYRRIVRAQSLRWWGGALVALAGVVAVVGSHLGLAEGLGFDQLMTEPLGGVGHLLALSDSELVRALGVVLAGVGVALTFSRRGISGLSAVAVFGSAVLAVLALELWHESATWGESTLEFWFTRGTGLYAVCLAAAVAAVGAVLTLISLVVMPARYDADALEWEATQDDPARGGVQVGE